ncbi:GapR family DNA-binding domain-containing protein, partial [Novosphingobium sp. HR1a]
MKVIVKLRRMQPDDRREMDMIVDTYKNALGID